MDQVLYANRRRQPPGGRFEDGFNAITKGSAAHGFGPTAARQANHEAEKNSVDANKEPAAQGHVSGEHRAARQRCHPRGERDLPSLRTTIRRAEPIGIFSQHQRHRGSQPGTVVFNECAGSSTSFASVPRCYRGRPARRHGVGWRRRDGCELNGFNGTAGQGVTRMSPRHVQEERLPWRGLGGSTLRPGPNYPISVAAPRVRCYRWHVT